MTTAVTPAMHSSCSSDYTNLEISLPMKQHLDQNSSAHSTWLSNLSPLQALYQWLYAANIKVMNKND
jgi:hypothetical protein